ncbi:gamma-glutamyl-gamma-aminobutyrate hydrolase family protein [Streptacidiphilus carbonis]|uniref:gamma-glutamyl-gamma-aminobutyrate hydrolase family protein n=1 Tax=Streptacidiphilus carbonis TaxID=105422 RepID=UPI0005A9CB65|nr:gamma-glutamyl-gamma-aminobutyrate hydrolase family protein [Streptacidiphilus carbonis]
MNRPLIGVTTYLVPAAWGVWTETQAALLPVPYSAQVQLAGGIAAMLPPGDPGTADDVVSRLDGLVVSGGPDVDPARYGAPRDPRTDPAPTERDGWELALIAAALRQRVPLLGICRGMQLLNIACGGDLVQHLPDTVGHEGHSPTPGAYSVHPVVPVPGTRLAGLLGESAMNVPTYHHQGAHRLGAGLVASAHHTDGTVEAVEPAEPAGGFVLGVQWHPEQGTDLRLFQALVQAAVNEGSGARTAPVPG